MSEASKKHNQAGKKPKTLKLKRGKAKSAAPPSDEGRPEWVVLPDETSEALEAGQIDVVTRWFREPSFSLCGEGAENTTVSVVKEGGDGCTGWAIVPADTVLHLKGE
jgi:hypothetical protein